MRLSDIAVKTIIWNKIAQIHVTSLAFLGHALSEVKQERPELKSQVMGRIDERKK